MSLCERVLQELPQYVADGEPPMTCYEGLRAHLRACPACRAYAARLRIVEDALRTYPAASPAPEMAALVMHRISMPGSRGEHERFPLPWVVWVPALAFVLAFLLAMMSIPPSLAPTPPVLEVESSFTNWLSVVDAYLESIRALMSKDLFWAVWSGVFATTAGLGLSLSLACWSTRNSQRLGQLEERVTDMAAELWNHARRAG